MTVNYVIESSELEEIRVTFKINKKKFSARYVCTYVQYLRCNYCTGRCLIPR